MSIPPKQPPTGLVAEVIRRAHENLRLAGSIGALRMLIETGRLADARAAAGLPR